MRLFHYSASPLALPLYSVEQEQDEGQFPYCKPKGLWLSVEGKDDWPHWCQAEQFNLEKLAYGHEIRLHDDARIIWLTSAADIDIFTERYGRPLLGIEIAWSAVAHDYQGIIIAPYIGSRRLHRGTAWYYGWDCASGCVWDVSAIAEIALPPTNAPQNSCRRGQTSRSRNY